MASFHRDVIFAALVYVFGVGVPFLTAEVKQMAGTVLGSKHYYAYTADSTKVYATLMRDADALATGFVACGYSDYPARPRQIKMRGVWTKGGTSGARRFFKCPLESTTVYKSGGTISGVDGEDWVVTGRKGERAQGVPGS